MISDYVGKDIKAKKEDAMIMTRQQAEIETIKPRSLSINLSDADVKRIAIKAGTAGLTVSQLIENFIGDLVEGTYTNGSDERKYAREWFDRCTFFFEPDGEQGSFLQYTLMWGMVFDVLDLWDGIQNDREILASLEEENEPDYEVDRDAFEEDLDYLQEELNDIFQEFLRNCKDKEIYNLNTEMEKIVAWRNADVFLQQERD